MAIILNYTTKVPVETTISEIQKALAQIKITAMMSEYDDDGVITGLAFRINTQHGVVSYRLPANIDSIYTFLQKHKGIDRNAYRTREHACRVAWRIVKDWVEAQVALIQAEQADKEQIFLPYAQTHSGSTVYELFQSQGQKLLALENK